MKNLLFHLLAKYVFPSIKYVYSSISNKRMAKYVLPSIFLLFGMNNTKADARGKKPLPIPAQSNQDQSPPDEFLTRLFDFSKIVRGAAPYHIP